MKMKFSVTGMSCAACSARVEKVVSAIEGVERAEVNLLAGTLVVYAAQHLSADSIVSAVQKAGYSAALQTGQRKQAPSEKPNTSAYFPLIISFSFLLVLMYFSMGHMAHLPMPGWYIGDENAVVAALLQFMLTLPVIFINRKYYNNGLKTLFHRSPNMDSLIAVGSGAALVYGIAALGYSDRETNQDVTKNGIIKIVE